MIICVCGMIGTGKSLYCKGKTELSVIVMNWAIRKNNLILR
nr:MAG TPA: Dephospho-CoA kinase [Caudoviricetes sp.]